MKKIIAFVAAFILAANTSSNVFAKVTDKVTDDVLTNSSPFFLGTDRILMATDNESAFKVEKLILDAKQAYGPGDVNGDGIINVLDYIILKNYFLNPDEEYVIYSGESSTDYLNKTLQLNVSNDVPDIVLSSASFDVNNDDVVNTLDLVAEVKNLIGETSTKLNEFNASCFSYEVTDSLNNKEQFISVIGQCNDIFPTLKTNESHNKAKIGLSDFIDLITADLKNSGIEKIFYDTNVISFKFRGKEYIMKIEDCSESIVYEDEKSDVSELEMSLYWVRERHVSIYELINNNTITEVCGYTFVHTPEEDLIFSSFRDNQYVEELPDIVNDYLEENGHFEIINKELVAKY